MYYAHPRARVIYLSHRRHDAASGRPGSLTKLSTRAAPIRRDYSQQCREFTQPPNNTGKMLIDTNLAVAAVAVQRENSRAFSAYARLLTLVTAFRKLISGSGRQDCATYFEQEIADHEHALLLRGFGLAEGEVGCACLGVDHCSVVQIGFLPTSCCACA